MMKYFIAIIICLFGISDGYRLIRQTACKVTASRELTLQNRQHSQRFRLFPANATPTSKFSEIHAPFKASIKYAISSIVAAAMFASPLTQQPARAGIFDSQEQNTVYEIGGYQKVVNELLDQLRPIDLPNAVGVYIPTQLLKGGKEDSAVVLNYQETYFKPLQEKMDAAAKVLKVPSKEDQEKLQTLPLLMKGHILELTQAINEGTATAQSKEVEEIQETLADFLKILSTSYKVDVYRPPRPLTEKDYLGPLGCEFWGKKRIEGSNACTDK